MARVKYDPLEAAKLGTETRAATPAPRPPQPAESDDLDDDEPPARRPRYRVTRAHRVSIRGNMCDFKEGRILDSAGYDIETLKAQGLEIELIEE